MSSNNDESSQRESDSSPSSRSQEDASSISEPNIPTEVRHSITAAKIPESRKLSDVKKKIRNDTNQNMIIRNLTRNENHIQTGPTNGFEVSEDDDSNNSDDSEPKRMDTHELNFNKKILLLQSHKSSSLVNKYYQSQKSLIEGTGFEKDSFVKDIDLKTKKHRFIIRSNSSFRLRWDLFIMLLAIFNCIVAPVNVAYQPQFMNEWYFVVLNSIIDFLFFVDIVVNFRTAFLHFKTGDEVSDPK